MKIGISVRGFEWAGGIELLRHFVNALLLVRDVYPLEIHLLLPEDNYISSLRDVRTVGVQVLRRVLWDRSLSLPRRRARWDSSLDDYFLQVETGAIVAHRHENSLGGLLRCARKVGVNVLFPVKETVGPGFPIPWIGYIPDFQHRYLTHLFAPNECFEREVLFASLLRDATVTVVNARAARDDVMKFFPWAAPDSIVALPFAPAAPREWFDALGPEILAAYDLPKRYFVVSNQFWAHKDHRTAFRALATVSKHEQFTDVGMVCTGAMHDYRHAGHMEEIHALIREHDLSRRLRLLGHIPKRHQVEIMKQSVSSVQPTLFEGGPGGGSTYDAVALGVPVILSDISVNREVQADNLDYFKPGDHAGLAEAMISRLLAPGRRPPQHDLEARASFAQRHLGQMLYEALAAAATRRTRTT